MLFADWIGTLAAVLTTSSFVPQVLHTFRTKDEIGRHTSELQSQR